MMTNRNQKLPREFADCEPHQQRAWFERRNREMAADMREAAEYARTPKGRLERLERREAQMRLEHRDFGQHTEGEIREMQRTVRHAQDDLRWQAQATFAAEWPLETTKSRRAEWNGLVKSGQLTKRGKTWWPAIRQQEAKQGWTMDALKRAVEMHGL